MSTLTEKSGTFTGTGAPSNMEQWFSGKGDFNVSISGTFTGVILFLQRSFDDGATWHNVARDTLGTPASFSSPISFVVFEPENAVYYRFNCTAFGTGTVNWRFGR